MPDFKDGMKIGNLYEQKVLRFIQKVYPLAFNINSVYNDKSFPYFDIYVPEIHKRYEVKSDQTAFHTKRFLIEVRHYDKRSALLTTKAEEWIFYDKDYYIYCDPNEVKNLILDKGYRQETITGKGDTHAKQCYFAPREDIYEIARIKHPSDMYE